MTCRFCWSCVALPLLGLLLAAEAAAQVNGRVLDPDGGAPVSGALVHVLGPSGDGVRSAVTAAAGSFRLNVPTAGIYTFRMERIGYATADTTLTISDPNELINLTLIARTDAIRLGEIRAESAPRCGPSSANADAMVLWTEARKALEIAENVRQAEGLRLQGFMYLRHYDRRGRRVVAEEQTEPRVVSGPAFDSRTPSDLARHGFVISDGDSTLLLGPTAEVLLSDEFLAGHCFHVQRRGAPSSGMVGLAFQPVPDSELPGIAGVLWLDERSASLQRIDFEFRNHELPGPAEEYRGTVEFARSDSGLWYVSRWLLRSPVTRRVEAGGVNDGIGWDLLAGIREQGGEVIEAALNEAHVAIGIEAPGSPQPRTDIPSAPAPEPPAAVILERAALDSIAQTGGGMAAVVRTLGLHSQQGRLRTSDHGPQLIACISATEVADWPAGECPMVEVWLNGRRLDAPGIALLNATLSMFDSIGLEPAGSEPDKRVLTLHTRATRAPR